MEHGRNESAMNAKQILSLFTECLEGAFSEVQLSADAG
jgi:hypothetical protein